MTSSTPLALPVDPSAAKGILLMVVAMGLLASMDAAAKTLVQDYSVWQVIFVRHTLLLLACLAWLGPRTVVASLRSRRPVLQLVRVTALITEIGLVLWSFRFLPLADVHAVLAVAPLFVTALAFWILAEPVGIRRWAAVAVGFLGVLLIIRPGLGVFQPASLVVLFAAFLWATYQVVTRLVSRDDPSETTFLYLVLAGCILPGLVMPWVWQTPADTQALTLFLVVSVLGAAGHLCLLLALAAAPASTLQPFTYTLLVWAAVWGFVVFAEVPDLFTCVGASIVVLSGLYTWHRERKRALHRGRAG
ncbi:MAG: DMT family transporter [Pseudomonadota bacterium]